MVSWYISFGTVANKYVIEDTAEKIHLPLWWLESWKGGRDREKDRQRKSRRGTGTGTRTGREISFS